MRFFSNDARETTDEQARDDDQPEKVQSDPVAVPNQRPPSPWSTPAAADSPSTPENDRWDDADRQPDDSVVTTSSNTYAGSTAAPDPDAPAATPWNKDDARADGDDTRVDGDHTRVDGHDHGGPADELDLPLDDKSTTTSPDDDVLKDNGTFDEPTAVDPATDKPLSADDTDETVALKDEGDFNDPKAVDPVTETPLDKDDRDTAVDEHDTSSVSEPAVSEPAVVPVPVPVAAAAPASAPATAPAAKKETVFDESDAQSFQERWREVQLRFVDSPKDAAGDAAKLVDEAFDKLTAALKSQRDGLTNDTEDTEQLRVQLRGYRDILNRILGL
ncbi:hypothetical protein [Actinoplanes friuliensis]|uniref:Uncharacterized protein n=1 Tax=Actinoplanes friuliensis DSM 7358 TaxID=1246995 RepID=U5VVE7_9ACTN|nr:hypothetical protein [Actinoplanes friuliensis]AGZ39680.1 hypothetical protein AFR_06955 [Actinoplanes friuliensis DSM 7358]